MFQELLPCSMLKILPISRENFSILVAAESRALCVPRQQMMMDAKRFRFSKTKTLVRRALIMLNQGALEKRRRVFFTHSVRTIQSTHSKHPFSIKLTSSHARSIEIETWTKFNLAESPYKVSVTFLEIDIFGEKRDKSENILSILNHKETKKLLKLRDISRMISND